MVLGSTHNGNRIAGLCPPEVPDLIIDGNITRRRVTDHWPLLDLRAFPTQRPVAVPGRPLLRAMVCLDVISAVDDVVLIEAQVENVGFWSAREARFHRTQQVCVSDAESLAAERVALEQM